jgi:16S rRNA (cytosine967-C5)-methyltransferase
VSGEKPRQIAAQVLQRHRAGAGFIEEIFENTLARSPLAAVDRALCQELVFGTVRWQSTLDWLVRRKTGARPQKPALRALLWLGLYQLFWLDRIPPHAAVHETVELAKQSGCGPQAGFVNALLRGYLREFDATRLLLAELKDSAPHLGYSHPEWLVARWRERWSPAQVARLLDWNNTPPRTCARVNALRTDPARLLARWREEKVEADPVRRDWLEENLVFEFKAHPPLATLRSFQEGDFYVQDPGTLLAVRELDPQPGETILDLCAAPGGKTTYAAQLMGNRGRIIAYDASRDRLKLLTENCARLGVTCVQTAPPARSPSPGTNLPPVDFHRILVDAPCSNTGVIRRRVDLRWRLRAEEIGRLRKIQSSLLLQAAPRLKPGGTLVYSTCSLEPEENRQIVEQFLRADSRFRLDRERGLMPFADGVDGAYVARLVRA